MKNTLLVLAIAFIATFSAMAQDSLSVSTSDLKPVAGNKTAEVNFDLHGSTFLHGGQLRFRKFTTNTKAMRLGISAYFDNDTHYASERTATYSSISISPGIERHFAGTKRLSPYIGVELPLSYAYSRYEDQIKTIKGSWYDGSYNRANNGIGLNVLAGVDLYIIKNFYVGFEFGAGVSYRHYREIDIDYKEDFGNNDSTIDGKNNISLNTFTSGGIRLGFAF